MKISAQLGLAEFMSGREIEIMVFLGNTKIFQALPHYVRFLWHLHQRKLSQSTHFSLALAISLTS